MLRKQRRIKASGRALSLFASMGFGVITAGAFHMVFPGLSYGFAVMAGMLTVAVEGEIFWKDVPQAMLMVFIKGPANHIKQSLVRSYMKEKLSALLAKKLIENPYASLDAIFTLLCNEDENAQNNAAYYQALIRYERMAIEHELSPEEQREFNTDLPALLEAYELSVFQNQKTVQSKSLSLSEEEALALKKLSSRYIWLNQGNQLLAIITGLGFGAFAFMKAGSLIAYFTLGAAFTAASPLWLLVLTASFATLAFAAYGFTMYHSLSLLLSVHPRQIKAKFFQFWNTVFQRKPSENTWLYALRFSVTSIPFIALTALTLIAVLGEGGAWFAAISSFVSLLMPLSLGATPLIAMILAGGIVGVAVPVFAVFMFKSIATAVVSITNQISQKTFRLKEEDKNYRYFVHLLNPFVWIDRLPIFILAHVWFEGAVAGSGVRCGAAQIAAWSGASLVELLVDLPYVEDEHHSSDLKSILLKSGGAHTHGYVLTGLLFLFRVAVLVPACAFELVFSWDCSYSWKRLKDTFSIFSHHHHHHHHHDDEQSHEHGESCSHSHHGTSSTATALDSLGSIPPSGNPVADIGSVAHHSSPITSSAPRAPSPKLGVDSAYDQALRI